MINAERIAEMKRMEKMVTEGPWKLGRPSPNGLSNIGTEYGLMTAQCFKASNAQFIAESRQFVPDIIAAYEETKKQSAFWYEQFVNMTDAHAEQAEEIAKLRRTLIDIYEHTSDLTIIRTITRNHYDIPLEAE